MMLSQRYNKNLSEVELNDSEQKRDSVTRLESLIEAENNKSKTNFNKYCWEQKKIDFDWAARNLNIA